jgi:peptidoglycan/LPS O-acetylase OafA/YrhL
MAAVFKVNNFDLLRIFAASQVVIVHSIAHLQLATPTWAAKLISAFPGVPIFFVISGFLISASFQRSTTLAGYWRNRALRILPALWCCVVATIIIAVFFGYNFLNPRAAAWFLSQLAGLIYTPGFLKEFGFGSYNGSLWTIPIELQFYFLLPPLYWLACRSRTDGDLRLWMTWLLFTAIALAASTYTEPLLELAAEPLPAKLFRYSFVPHFYLFVTGVLLQRLQFHSRRWVDGKGLFWLVGYLAFYYLAPASAARDVACMLLLGLTAVAMAYTIPTAARRLLRGHDISYGVYIYHGLLLNILVELGMTGRWIVFPLLAVCTYLAGVTSWLLVERRFLQRKASVPA